MSVFCNFKREVSQINLDIAVKNKLIFLEGATNQIANEIISEIKKSSRNYKDVDEAILSIRRSFFRIADKEKFEPLMKRIEEIIENEKKEMPIFYEVLEGRKEKMIETKVKMEVDTTELDEAIVKTKILNEELQKAKGLIGDLSEAREDQIIKTVKEIQQELGHAVAMGEMKIKIEISSGLYQERIKKMMDFFKEIQQENDLKLTLLEISIEDTRRWCKK